MSIIQGFVPYIDMPSREDNAMEQINKSESNGDAIYNFFPNISRYSYSKLSKLNFVCSYVDILDTKLSDILSNVRRLGATFAKAAMDIESQNDDRLEILNKAFLFCI